MSKRVEPLTLTEALRQALSEVDSLRAVDRATGVNHPSMIKFLRGEQSLRLDMADRLATYFEIKIVPSKGTRKSKAKSK